MTMSLVLWAMRIKRLSGVGTGDGGGVVSGSDGSPTHGPSGSSSATPNLAWNFGI